MSVIRPRVRLPLWAIIALPLGAYGYRSFARGWDVRPDLPQDLIALAVYALVVGVALWSRRTAAEQVEEHLPEQQDAEDSQG